MLRLSDAMSAYIPPEATETRNARTRAGEWGHGNRWKIMNRLVIVCLLAVQVAGVTGAGEGPCARIRKASFQPRPVKWWK